MRPIEYKVILRPSIEFLERCGTLMLDTKGMADFLSVPAKKMPQLICTDRIPAPRRLGLGHCRRWSVLELLEWVEAGCPGRGKWIEIRRHRGCTTW